MSNPNNVAISSSLESDFQVSVKPCHSRVADSFFVKKREPWKRTYIIIPVLRPFSRLTVFLFRNGKSGFSWPCPLGNPCEKRDRIVLHDLPRDRDNSLDNVSSALLTPRSYQPLHPPLPSSRALLDRDKFSRSFD